METAAASFPVKIGGRGGGQAAEVGRQPGEGRGGARGAARPSRTRHPGGVLGGVTRGVRRQRLGLGAREPRAAVRVVVALVTQVARRLVAGLVLEDLVIHHFKVLPYVLSELPIQSCRSNICGFDKFGPAQASDTAVKCEWTFMH